MASNPAAIKEIEAAVAPHFPVHAREIKELAQSTFWTSTGKKLNDRFNKNTKTV